MIDMIFRIGKDYRLADLEEIVVCYRESDTSATFTRLKEMELNTLKISRTYSRSASCKIFVGDRIYNAAHYILVWLVPPKLKIRLFSLWRNSSAT